ncbi:uncharacterized protein (TIGR02646 family) [Novosphingobium sp. 1748]|uniref:AAA family ATPase n=1 Tax=Novosphingobium sp. 1748 TaxID=2817760 RepID=UPI002860145E|nr:AAA family ATPase [Novosphingobium sp. 1748]MDR6708313.1 uncharacterized protein (TIGR02646 family) [Novosphingobium sp. 1748]
MTHFELPKFVNDGSLESRKGLPPAMRLIERNASPIPSILRSHPAIEFHQEIRTYLAENRPDTRPPLPPSMILEDGELRRVLEAMAHHSCMYCESPIANSEGVIEQFRPPGGAENPEGTIDFRHYSWLAIDWENLYLACYACSRSKANRFPVQRRGDVGDKVHELNNLEGYFLLDPCKDFSADHFFVERTGKLRSLDERGLVTIDMLRLNRQDLCRARADVKRNVTELMRLDVNEAPITLVNQLFGEHAHFAGIALISLLQQLPPMHPLQRLREVPIDRDAIDEIVGALELGPLPRVRERRQRPRTPRSNTPPAPTEEAYYVRSVHIRNFKGIAEATIDFPEQGKSGTAKVGSIVILGENGVGKSSALQALALGVLGPEKAQELAITPRQCLRDGAQIGEIIVHYFDTDRKNILRFVRGSGRFEGQEEVHTVVLGYGAHRLPARGPVAEDKSGYDYRLHSLFDERKLVNGPFGLHQHLRRNNSVDQFRLEDAMRTLNSLLLGAARASISPRAQLVIEDRGRLQPLSELSSGYQSMVTIASDIMDVLYQLWQGITSGRALVLIDEIDAHLHPEWRLKIVDALRKAFPATQFLMTTHDPLVLRGLLRREVLVMTRDTEGQAEIVSPQMPDLEALSIDQLLTSQLFGLETTMDHTVASNLSRYYSLVSKQNPSDRDIEDLNYLKVVIADQQPSGNTRRERLMYAVIDRFLARPDTARSVDAWDAEAVDKLLADLEIAEREALADDLSTS